MPTAGRAHIIVVVLVTAVVGAFVEHRAAGQVSLDADVRSAQTAFESYNQALIEQDYSKLLQNLLELYITT